MYYYVNHQAINEFFNPLEVETNPSLKLEMINNLQEEVIDRLVNHIAETCYQLKLAQWSTGQICEAFNLSERKVKKLIRYHSDKTKNHNPLSRHKALNFVDISHFVEKKSVGPASPPAPTQDQV